MNDMIAAAGGRPAAVPVAWDELDALRDEFGDAYQLARTPGGWYAWRNDCSTGTIGPCVTAGGLRDAIIADRAAGRVRLRAAS